MTSPAKRSSPSRGGATSSSKTPDRNSCAEITRSGELCKNKLWKDHPCCRAHAGASASTSVSSSAAAPAAFSTLPADLAGLIGGMQDRASRVTTAVTARQFHERLQASCGKEACLEKKVRASCHGVCEQRGAGLIQAAIDLDPRVLRDFTFLSHADHRSHAGARRSVQFTSEPWSKDRSLSDMKLTFTWRSSDTGRDSDRELSRETDWTPEQDARSEIQHSPLYLADGKEARDVLQHVNVLRHKAHEYWKREQVLGADVTEDVLGFQAVQSADLTEDVRDLEEVYERYRKPTTAGEISQQLARAKAVADEALEGADPAESANYERRHASQLQHTYLRVAGRVLRNLPAATPITFPLRWVAHLLDSLFRDGSSGGWHVDPRTAPVFQEEYGAGNDISSFTLQNTAPLDEAGWVFERLLSETPRTFDTLELAPSGRSTRASLEAERLLREGVRTWRGSDILSGAFRIDADRVFDQMYPETVGAQLPAEGQGAEEPGEGKEEKKSPPKRTSKRGETLEEREEAQRVRDETNVRMLRGLEPLPPRAPPSTLNYLGRRSPPR